MPRDAREKSKSGIYHIILRGINKQTIFEDEEDAVKFLQTLEHYKEKSGYKIYGYCLMGNHIHLLIKEEKDELGIVFRRIGASYVYWYNWKYERVGPLFQDRYKSEVVEDDNYLLTVLRYIHQNPLKAGLVRKISEYRWSSYSEYLAEGRSGLVDEEDVLEIFHQDRDKSILMFKEFHQIKIDDVCLDINENKRIKDSEAIELVKSICNTPHCKDIQKLEEVKRSKYLKMLKDRGLSTRQIARITGISRGLILKA